MLMRGSLIKPPFPIIVDIFMHMSAAQQTPLHVIHWSGQSMIARDDNDNAE